MAGGYYLGFLSLLYVLNGYFWPIRFLLFIFPNSLIIAYICYYIFFSLNLDGAYQFKDIFASVYDCAGNVDLNKCY